MWPNRAHGARPTNQRSPPGPEAREEGDKEQKGKVHQARTPPSRQATKSRSGSSSRGNPIRHASVSKRPSARFRPSELPSHVRGSYHVAYPVFLPSEYQLLLIYSLFPLFYLLFLLDLSHQFLSYFFLFISFTLGSCCAT